MINVISKTLGTAFCMNIHGCQMHPKIAIYVGKQLKNVDFNIKGVKVLVDLGT